MEGQENIQEILTKQLVLCQYMCALGILQTGTYYICVCMVQICAINTNLCMVQIYAININLCIYMYIRMYGCTCGTIFLCACVACS